MIKYLGSKRTLVSDLVRIVACFDELRSVTDLFSGTARVGHAFKRAGLCVSSNDNSAYAHALASCYVAADRERVAEDAQTLIAELNRLPGRPGYFTKAFCEDSRFFQPKNGARVDAIREAIAAKALPPVLESVLLVSLMEAADRVDSTCGVHMAYVKKWAPRAFNELELRMPDVLAAVPHGSCRATRMDALDAALSIDTDVVYIDPPYNQHSYLSNYHIWETLVLWDKPEYYGVACKRIDCRTRKSVFNLRNEHARAFAEVLQRVVHVPLVVVSFSDEGFQTRSELEAMLRAHGELRVIRKDFKRYVGAQIGIHNPEGERVGEVSHVRNEESIYVLAPAASPRHAYARTRLAALGEIAGVVDDTSMLGARAGAHNAPEQALLRALREHGELSAGELRRRTGLTAYRVGSSLRRLLEHGAVAVRYASSAKAVSARYMLTP